MNLSDTSELERLRARVERERRAREEAEEIAERTTRELYARQRELALLVEVASAANDAADAHAALGRAIGAVCTYTGWPVGHVFIADPAVGLRPSGIWHLDRPERFETFRRVTDSTTLAPGESLGGRVLETGTPAWLPDIAEDPSFAQGQVSSELGVRTGFGFPILVGEEVVAVMEFFNEANEPPDDRLLELMGQVGTELGRAIERDRARAAEHRLSEDLAARARELERSNADLDQFASIASHDLQEPLRKVRTFSQRVIETESANLSETGRDYLERANAGAARMQTLVEDLLTFSRVATRPREWVLVDLAQTTDGVLADLETAIERTGATVRVGALPTITADGLQMRQLMQNLIANALKFRRADVAPEIAVTAEGDGDVIALTVADNGIGIDPRYAERIFRVFERLHTRTEYEGNGIGLALCRKIAERHGGSVAVTSALGAGTTFTVTLPVHQSSRA